MFSWFKLLYDKIIGVPKKEPITDIPIITNMITVEQLKAVVPSLNINHAGVITDLLNELCPKYGLTDKEAFRKFLANLAHESGDFSHKSENMNYRRASTIQKTWPSRFPTVESTIPFVKNPQGLGNKVYNGRLGNNEPNDGWTYRGAGFIQLTGKENFTKYANYIRTPVEETANLMRTTDRYALDSALWFFCVHKKIASVASTVDFKFVVKMINGGYVGLDQREIYYQRCKKYIL